MYSKSGKISNGILTNTFSNTIIYNFWKIHSVTIVANQSTLANVRKNKYFREGKIKVVVTEGVGITELKATKVNVLTATFATPVDTDDVTLTVTRGNKTVPTSNIVWNEDKTIATITTTAKMMAGTYTLTAASKADTTKKSEKSVEIENQYVADIQILNDVALTGRGTLGPNSAKDEAAARAFVYYKVLDQYGEDLTASTSIQWSTSCGAPERNDRGIGKLTLKRTDDKAFTYGEQIYVTGVYAKTGKSVNATLTVGAEQALDSVEMIGFVKKNTATLRDSLPIGFKSGEYYLVFDALDQNGNFFTPSAELPDEATFISDNVLLVSEIKNNTSTVKTTIVVEGHEYNAVMVAPGQFVDRGGEVNITAIATKTGKQTKKNFVVGQNQILTSFAMSSPVDVVSDGEANVEIPFRALDQNGEEITNFVTLADNLNQLTFNTSDGVVKLAEEDDGTAKLLYSDNTKYQGLNGWAYSETTDGIDRTISITAVVVSGGTDSLLLSISDKARPDSIEAVKVDSVMVEGTMKRLGLDDFTFRDQYGRVMIGDNNFFEAAKDGGLKGMDFSGYKYDVVMSYTGNGGLVEVSHAGITSTINETTNGAINATPLQISTHPKSLSYGGIQTNGNATFITNTKITNSAAGNIFTFAIAKAATSGSNANVYETVSTEYKKNFTVVDISQVRNFAVKDFNKLYVETDKTPDITGVAGTDISGKIMENVSSAAINPGYEQNVVVTGTYNGNTVTIPAGYYTVKGNKVSSTNGAISLTGTAITFADKDAIKYSDLYNANAANYVRKDTSDIITVRVYKVFANENDPSGVLAGTVLPLTTSAVTAASPFAINIAAVNKNIVISDAAPVVTKINAPDTITINPTKTVIRASDIMAKIEQYANHGSLGWWAGHGYAGTCVIENQYGKSMMLDNTTPTGATITYRISSIQESDGFADNNFTVDQNDSFNTNISGAERGDTFVLTITAKDSSNGVTVSKDVLVTVGADTEAILTTNGISYNTKTDNLVTSGLKATLDQQRLDALGH